MRKGIIAVALSCFIALLAARAVSLTNYQGQSRGDAPNSDLQDVVCDTDWTLPARFTIEATKQEHTEGVVFDFPSAHLCSTSRFFGASNSIPARFGKDLLTFIRQRTT